MPWAKRQTSPIPSITSPQTTIELNDYSQGLNSFLSNDKFPLKTSGANMWRLAQDARMPVLGEYSTRKALDYYSDAAGETLDRSLTSTVGPGAQSFSETTYLAQKWTAAASGNLSKMQVKLRNISNATGTVIVEHWTDSGGSIGSLVARSSIAGNAITTGSTFVFYTARFASAPAVVSGTSYWIVVYVQLNGSSNYTWSSTSTATTAMVSTDSGTTWSTTSFGLNFQQYYATDGPVLGLYRAYKSDGTKVTLYAHGTSLYTVNDANGALTAIKTGLSSSATAYEFTMFNDVVYYVNGYDGVRKWNFATESQVMATNYTLITVHKGVLVLGGGADPNAVVYSNFGLPEVFTGTDFVYADVPKNGDPVTALQSLNGNLFIPTRANKLVLSGDDNATFSVDEAPDQKGTYTQKTMTVDKNYMYFLSDDAMYRSNGSESQSMTENIFEEIRTLQNKNDCAVVVNKGRLYLWYASAGSAYNDRCYVWNLNYGSDGRDCIESVDTGAYVARAITASGDDDRLLVGSSRIGQVCWQELDSNDYTNMGGDLNFELRTHYLTFDAPSQYKEIRYWKARFATSSTNNTVTCQYATDLRDNAQDAAYLDVQANGYIWGDPSTIWGQFFWGAESEVEGDLYVPGEYKRIQIRYKHSATRQPVRFLGHTFRVQLRRLR